MVPQVESGVIELAAKAEPQNVTGAVIGRSVTEFLMANKPKIVVAEPTLILADPHEQKCVERFSAVLNRASREIPGWKRMNWEQRYEVLKRQEENA